MKILVSLLCLSLLSFTTIERDANEPKLRLISAPPSDSLSLKNFRIPVKNKEDDKASSSAGFSTKKVSNKVLIGSGTYYASYFEGRKTANGEIFSHSKANVASNHFKLNTWVKVTNPKNGKSFIAKVTDRMHPRMAAKGRIIDMTSKHAKYIDIFGRGVAKIKVEQVEFGTKE